MAGRLFGTIFLVTSAVSGERCRHLMILPPVNGKALINHVAHTFKDIDTDNCHTKCYEHADKCMSVNHGTQSDGTQVCELSMSDHIRHPSDLAPRDGFRYYATKNGCSKGPCRNGGQCIPGDLPDLYSCVCPKGITGHNCDQDLNECSSGNHNCSVKANCTNTYASFICSCIDGYYGDGVTCRGCPSGWSYNRNTGSCYYLPKDKLDWNNAALSCKNMSAWLVIVDDKAENDYLHYNLSVGSRWIGVTDQETEGVWKDSKGQPLLFYYWHSPNQPNNWNSADRPTGADCAYTYSGAQGKWDDAPCNDNKRYICEKTDQV